MPGCTLDVSLDLLAALPSPSGSSTWSLALPSTPALAGVRIFQQAATLAPGVNPFGFVTSNHGTATLGP